MTQDTISEDQAAAAIVAEFEASSRRFETPCGDRAMVWRAWGEGEPVVLGHGAQGGWSHWIRNIDAIAKERMVLAADLPGHGDSAMPAADDHPSISAALAEGLREILGDRLPVDFVGFSFGGTVFAYLAKYYPGIVRRLILVGCGGLDTPIGDVRLRRVGGLQGEERLTAIKDNILGLMLHSAESVDSMAMYLQMWNGKRARLHAAGDLVIPDKLLKALPDVNAPVDAIWGEYDRPHPVPKLQEDVLRQFQPDTDFRVIEGGGHWVMYERPDEFNRLVVEMLANPPRALKE